MIEHERLARTKGWAALAGTKDETDLPWSLFRSRENLSWYDRLRLLFASENFSLTDAMIRRTLEAQTQQQMALTVLSIQRCRLRSGKGAVLRIRRPGNGFGK